MENNNDTDSNRIPQTQSLHIQFRCDGHIMEHFIPSKTFHYVDQAKEYICQVYEIQPRDILYCKAITKPNC